MYMNKARNNCTKREICNNFNNPINMWEIINKFKKKIIKKSSKMKAKHLSDKFAQEFELNVKMC